MAVTTYTPQQFIAKKLMDKYPGVEIRISYQPGGDYILVGMRKRGSMEAKEMKLSNTLIATLSPDRLVSEIEYGLGLKGNNIGNKLKEFPKEEPKTEVDNWLKSKGY